MMTSVTKASTPTPRAPRVVEAMRIPCILSARSAIAGPVRSTGLTTEKGWPSYLQASAVSSQWRGQRRLAWSGAMWSRRQRCWQKECRSSGFAMPLIKVSRPAMLSGPRLSTSSSALQLMPGCSRWVRCVIICVLHLRCAHCITSLQHLFAGALPVP